MTQIHAISAGLGAETERFTGTVHSVFKRACNISLDDGRLLSLVCAESGNAPSAIRLDTPPGFSFDRTLRTGERVGCRAGVIRFNEAEIAVRLSTAQPWCLDLDELGADLRNPEVFKSWCASRRALKEHDLAVPWTNPAVPPGRSLRLWRAARMNDVSLGTSALRALIGCGVGLTPAGDDIVVGFFAGLRATRRGNASQLDFCAKLADAAKALITRTNPISGSYLLHAADGRFAEPIAHLAAVIAKSTGEREVEMSARAALAVGATSGSDGVRGLLLGLASGGWPHRWRGTGRG